MGRWKYRGEDHDDESPSVGKIRRRRTGKKRQGSPDPFILEKSKWDLSGDTFIARVVEVQKRYAFISPEPHLGQIATKDVWLATVARRHLTAQKKERNLICVGDRVLCRPSEEKDGVVQTDLPCCVILNRDERSMKVSRRDPLKPEIEHVLASNIDQLVIVASYLKPLVKFGLIDRYLLIAEEQNLPATIVLNKVDLLKEAKEPFREKCSEMVALYRSLGYTVIETSTTDSPHDTLGSLRQILSGRISIVSGHSGVGKSSLVNLFSPEIVQEVEENDDIFYKGRHTTTYASFIKLKSLGSAYVIDTPGIRSFTLGEKSAIELSSGFREFIPHLGSCKYRECRHIDEPGCKILELVESGEIHPSRYRSYCGLLLGDSGREGRSGLVEKDVELEVFDLDEL